MSEMKRKRRCSEDCKQHIFCLRKHNGASKLEIKLSLCPKHQRDPAQPLQTYPQFNDDKKYYTSAFILGVDRKTTIKNQQQDLMDHQKQVRDSLEKIYQLIFPRPNSKHSMCNVCKDPFINYYMHIFSDQHKEKINLSSYNKHIIQLCSFYSHLWEGAAEKADEIEEQRLKQLQQQQNIESSQEQKDSGSMQNQNQHQKEEDQLEDQDQGISIKQTRKIPHKKKIISKSYCDPETVPLGQKLTQKRGRKPKYFYEENNKQQWLELRERKKRKVRNDSNEDEQVYEKKKVEKNPRGILRERKILPEKDSDIFIIKKYYYNKSYRQRELALKKNEQIKLKKQEEKIKTQKHGFQEKEGKKNMNSLIIDLNSNIHEQLRFEANQIPFRQPPFAHQMYPIYNQHGYYPPKQPENVRFNVSKSPSNPQKKVAPQMFYPYHWPHNPYYYPMMPPPQSNQNSHNPKNDQIKSTLENNNFHGNTNININFPMYMYPPPNHIPFSGQSNRYENSHQMPHQLGNPYLGYPYPPPPYYPPSNINIVPNIPPKQDFLKKSPHK